MSAQFTERQAAAWPDAVAQAQRYVTTSTISADASHYYWTINWHDETRPGRGHCIDASWCDGEFFVQIYMDVYGYPKVSVAQLSWIHSDADEECACEPCENERKEDE